MYVKTLGKFLLAAASLVVLACGSLFLSSKSRDEAGMRRDHIGFQFQGKPYSGLLLDTYGNHWPKSAAFLWQGKYVGSRYLWHSNGRLRGIHSYRQGKPHGHWREWYSDGSVSSSFNYVEGKVDGELWAWHPNGTVSYFRYFENGREIAYKSFISDGKPFYNLVLGKNQSVGLKGGQFCKTR